MQRRRNAVALAALCVALAVTGAPATTAQPPASTPTLEVGDLPALIELPPLPERGSTEDADEEEDTSETERSGVQTAAFALAVGVLVAGGLGLALATRRGRPRESGPDVERPDTPDSTPSRR